MATGKETKSPAPWSTFPDFEHFWNSYCDLFWGTGGDTSFHDMLEEDIEWIKKAYLQNNESLTQLESNYMNELEGSQVALRFGGGPQFNMLPKASKHIAEQRLEVGGQQAKRITDYAERFTPNKAHTDYMKYLEQLGMKGQELRMGMPTSTGKLDEERGLLSNIGDVASLGSTGMDIYKGGKDSGLWKAIGNSDIWKTISSWWK